MLEDRIIGDRECRQITNLSRTTRWRMERSGKFPNRKQISVGRVGWLMSEIVHWIENQRAWHEAGVNSDGRSKA